MTYHHTCATCSAQDAPLRMSTAKAAEYLGVAESTLRAWRHSDTGPTSFALGTKVIYDRTDLDDWLAAEKAKTMRGGAPMDAAAPCREQSDRDRLADPDLPDHLDDRVGTGPHAIDEAEALAQ